MKNLLILGAGVYGAVAREIAESTGAFDKIAYVDDCSAVAFDGTPVAGRICDVAELSSAYGCAVVAIGNPSVRLALIERLTNETPCEVISLISPRAFVSPSARIGVGCVVEPHAVVHARAVLETGCLVSAGAVVNHAAVCREGVHVDCNATVAGNVCVPRARKIQSNTCFNKTDETEALK